MKILKYKTIENVKYVSKDIPITKKDIKIVEKKEDDNELDIFESKEYTYKEVKKDDYTSITKNIQEKNTISDMIEEIEKKYSEVGSNNNEIIINNDEKEELPIKTESNNDSDILNYNTIDISKELDEDIYSDIKANIEKSLEDDAYLDDPYKAAVKLSKEDTDKAQRKHQYEQSQISNIESKSIEEMLEETETEEKEEKSSLTNNDIVVTSAVKEKNDMDNETIEDVEMDTDKSKKEPDNLNNIISENIVSNNVSEKLYDDNKEDISESGKHAKENNNSKLKNKIVNIYNNIFTHPEDLEKKLGIIFRKKWKISFFNSFDSWTSYTYFIYYQCHNESRWIMEFYELCCSD